MMMIMRNLAVLAVLLAAGMIKYNIASDNAKSEQYHNDDDFHKYKLNDPEQNSERSSRSTSKSNTKTPMNVREQNYKV